tara:strand:- start:1523 stop:3790 length:2268 start_codon:yes stop_codon:yes gene_type:complete
MAVLSPPLVAYKKPLQGMDARETRAPGAPAMLFNVDTSWQGTWRARPGFFFNGGSPGSKKCVGIHPFRRGSDFFYVIMMANVGSKVMEMHVYLDEVDQTNGNPITPLFTDVLNGNSAQFPGISEPYTTNFYYDFVQAGRFLYFCNGYGHLFELELTSPNPPVLSAALEMRSAFLEEGQAPSVLSYLRDGFKPASLHFFYNQLVACGFDRENFIGLSNPLDALQSDIPDDVLDSARENVLVTQSHVFVSEPLLWRSFPLEDAGGMYWLFDEDVVASENVRQTLLIFTTKSLFRVSGHGSATPRREWLADVRLVNARSMCHFGTYLFFVADDGCYVTDGGMVKKVSEPMDPLWFDDERPVLCRKTQQEFRPTVVPGKVNRRSLRHCDVVNDRPRNQIYVALTSAGGTENDMLWVWNYRDLLDQKGLGKWSIWGGALEPSWASSAIETEAITRITVGSPTQIVCGAANFTGDYPLVAGDTFEVKITGVPTITVVNGTFTATLLDAQTFTIPVDTTAYTSGVYSGTVHMPMGTGTNSMTAGHTQLHITAMAFDHSDARDEVIVGTADGRIYKIQNDQVDSTGVLPSPKGFPRYEGYPILIGLGLNNAQSEDSRTVYTDVSVRMKQTMRNQAQDDNSPLMKVVARSEGEAQKLLKATDVELEFEQNIDIMQEGVSQATTSVMGDAAEPGIFLGGGAGGTSSPLIEKEYHRFYARLNVPDEEGRGIVVDIHREAKDRPHRMVIEEVMIYGLPKGGSQREQS